MPLRRQALQDVLAVRMRVMPVELRRLDEAHDDRGTLPDLSYRTERTFHRKDLMDIRSDQALL